MNVLISYDDLKVGKCVGADKYGNHYYQNTRYFVGKRISILQFLILKIDIFKVVVVG